MVDLLKPFLVTAAHCGKTDLSDLEPAVREVFTKSELSKDPKRFNVFMFVLDSQARVVRAFHGLPGDRRSAAPGRSNHQAELEKAHAILKLPRAKSQTDGPPNGLPDLKPEGSATPAGVRLFIRQDDPSNTIFSKLPVVEVVPMTTVEWKPLAFAPNGKDIEPEALKSWLVWLYPAGIRAADEKKPFQKFSGSLKLQPAGSDDKLRYALLRGTVALAKGSAGESAFKGELEAVLTYRLDAPEIQSVRGVVQGTYLYRARGTSRQELKVAIESRPH